MVASPDQTWTYQERIELLRRTKEAQTREKQDKIGSMDFDDHALVLPPPEVCEIIEAISGSGELIKDAILKTFQPKPNHANGTFYGARATGSNFRALLAAHPPIVDPMSSLLGRYCVNFNSYRKGRWCPDYDYSALKPEQQLYGLSTGIGGMQHFCQDLAIGLELGFGGLLAKIRHYRALRGSEHAEFLTALEDVVLGIQAWIRTNVTAAREMAEAEQNAQLRRNLLQMAEMNERLVLEPPRTLREACQWIGWYDMTARMFNGSGSLGRLDVLLQPYYARERAAGTLSDEEAIFHIACLLLMDTAYIQLGGPDERGHDVTSRVSYLVLEAAHRLKIPNNLAVCVGKEVDPGLLRRGVELIFADRTGSPKFLGSDTVVPGFARNGYPLELARQRAYAGCHWFALPGREYCMNDMIKVNLAAVFLAAWDAMLADEATPPSVDALWRLFEVHLRRAIDVLAEGIDLHLQHMHEIAPELVLDLLCHGTIEKGLDATHGGVEFYNLGVDGAALATTADSFAALEQRVEQEGRLSWAQIKQHIDSDWAGPEGERARLMMRSIPRFGSGGSRADEYAQRIVRTFSDIVKEKPTPGGRNMIPGLFSWAKTLSMGKGLRATPNGRRAGAPISHGANPDPGFRKDGAPTAMAVAIASVQPGWGNPAPMQIELDPGLSGQTGVESVISLLRSHMDLGGTEVNLNIMDAAKVLDAHKNPAKYPDLIVRVTGFSAYFASLSPEFRQLVVDRIIAEGQVA